MKIAVIGNGGIALKEKSGQNIDESDFVIRCNFPPKIHPEYVGKKIDLMITSPGPLLDDINKPIIRLNKKYLYDYECDILIAMPKDFVNNSIPKEYARSHNHNFNARINNSIIAFQEGKFKNIDFVDSWIFYNLMDKLEKNKKMNGYPSTGIIAIEYAINKYPTNNIYIKGFDFYTNGHYYNDENPVTKRGDDIAYHPVSEERQLIRNYIKKGTLQFI